MAYTFDKKTGEITVNGWEKGIAPSPHVPQGVADLKNVNISSIQGEVSLAYDRVRQDQPVLTGQTATLQNSSADILYSTTLKFGTWILISAVTGGSAFTANNYYQVVDSTGTIIRLASTFGGTPIVADANATITFSTLGLGVPVSYASEFFQFVNDDVIYRYYVLDDAGIIWVSGQATDAGNPGPLTPTSTWSAITPYGTSLNSIGTGTINSIEIMYGTDSNNVVQTSFLIIFGPDHILAGKTSDKSAWPSVSGSAFPQLGGSNTLLNNGAPHRSFLGNDQVLYYTDGPAIGILQQKEIDFLNLTANVAAGDTSATLTTFWKGSSGANTVTFSTGETKSVTFTNNSLAITWSGGLSAAATTLISTGAAVFDSTDPSTYNYVQANYLMSPVDVATSISMIPSGSGLSIVVGGILNNIYIYPSYQASTVPGPTVLLWMPEAYTQNLLQVNNFVLIFSGNKGNIYLTNGSSVVPLCTVPDYVASSANFVQDPYFLWGGATYIRGRVFFSIQDQTGSHTGNCGGVWSFVPSFSYFPNQDAGLSLRMEAASSQWGTEGYNGYAPILFTGLEEGAQEANGPQYIACWAQSVNSIDFSGTTPVTNGSALIETDAIPVGTFLDKRTFSQIELKFASALVAGESVVVNYRTDLEAAWASAGTLTSETAAANGNGSTLSQIILGVDFQTAQIIQLQILMTGTATNPSWCRLQEIYIR